jgi:hypothetical protein
MSTIAVFLALAGGATAIAAALAKNSVKSRHIAPGAVKTSDLGRNAATGAKVREASLAEVPSATHADQANTAGTSANAGLLDNLDSATFPRQSHVSDANFGPSSLDLTVPGLGTYSVHCDTNSASLDDDEVFYGEQSSFGSAILLTGYNSVAPTPGEPASAFQVFSGSPSSGGTSIYKDESLHVVISVSRPATQQAAVLFLGGYDNEATAGCSGHIQAILFG